MIVQILNQFVIQPITVPDAHKSQIAQFTINWLALLVMDHVWSVLTIPLALELLLIVMLSTSNVENVSQTLNAPLLNQNALTINVLHAIPTLIVPQMLVFPIVNPYPDHVLLVFRTRIALAQHQFAKISPVSLVFNAPQTQIAQIQLLSAQVMPAQPAPVISIVPLDLQMLFAEYHQDLVFSASPPQIAPQIQLLYAQVSHASLAQLIQIAVTYLTRLVTMEPAFSVSRILIVQLAIFVIYLTQFANSAIQMLNVTQRPLFVKVAPGPAENAPQIQTVLASHQIWNAILLGLDLALFASPTLNAPQDRSVTTLLIHVYNVS